ncbi:acetate--CoA ligase [Conexibacter woesei]|uniref:bifunctional acetate--CoA ligase family protein/GNAT family N-acetyltransferase n=1 Tax=Conexibacter woesei TaxID=191495 RepID=UPI0004213DA5|nr:acetate--CoA ligase [Conexibacter woesei]
MPSAADYPSERVVDVALRDGRTVRIRPVRPDDAAGLGVFLDGLSPDSRVFRFFSAGADLHAAARAAADVDYRDRYGIVALSGSDGAIVAHGMYIRMGPGPAEVAFAVGDVLHGQGIATIMLAHLAEAAAANGIDQFYADVLPSNHRMVDVFRESGLDAQVRAEPGMLVVSMPTELSADAQARYDERDATAAAAAVEAVLRPRGLAVIGASERPGSVGGAVLSNVLAAGFTGTVHAVHPRAAGVHGVTAHPRITDISEPVDLAVIATPAAVVADAARDCVAKGVRAIVVISAGFGEAGPDGQERQRELLEICRAGGMRLVGPNCLGVLNTDPAVALNATFAPTQPPAGRVGFLSQSGALGIAVIEAAAGLNIGLSSFASVGDKADLSGNDFLSYWERDEQTDVVLLYLESFGNPRKFSRVARRVAARKPVIAVKGGRTPAGARGAGSHTGALLAGSDSAVDALFHQAGVVRTDTLGELFDVASMLVREPPPAGRRVGIVTNGGGLGILCADACEAAGLEVPETPAGTEQELRAVLPAEAAVGNPIDLLATASPDHFAAAIDALSKSDAVDALIVLYVPPLVTDPEPIAVAIRAAATRGGLPIAAVFAMREAPAAAAGLPCFRFPEDAARAVARAARYGAWRARPRGHVPALSVDDAAAGSVIAEALRRGPGWLQPAEATALLDLYGIAQPRHQVVPDAAGAVRCVLEWQTPVALKAIAPGLVHRTDAGAVATGLTGPAAVRREADAMQLRLENAGSHPQGFLVQEMAPAGVEVLVGVTVDPTFGPIVAVAAGGATTELLGDAAIRLTPLTDRDAHEMVRELRTFPLLDGFRGAAPCDVAAVEDVLLRLSAMAEAHEEIVEIEVNPLIVSPSGAAAVDVRARIAIAPLARPEPSLRSPRPRG